VKITIIGPAYPLRGGIAHHVYWLQRELTARGHGVQVISFRTLYPKFLFPGKTMFDASEKRLDAQALAVLNPLNPLTWIEAKRAIESFAPDLALVEWWHTFFSPALGSLIRGLKRAGIRSAIECHNIVPHERRWIDRRLASFTFSPVDNFITHSTADREDLLRLMPGRRVEVAYLPTFTEFTSAAEAARDGRTILFFGIVRKYKGLDVLLRAMPAVLAKVDCKLRIVGEFYEPLETYLQIIREAGVESSVEIVNRYVANEEVPQLFAEADVLALPYLNATQSAVARIAFANALPIVASRTGGLAEVVRDGVTGLLAPPGDADALAGKLVEYFTKQLGPTFAANLRSEAREQAGDKLIEAIARLARQG
jgi:glycosyltransferase involved in cell wall biosynthesis